MNGKNKHDKALVVRIKYRDLITLVVALLFVISISYSIGVVNIPFLFIIPLIALILVIYKLWM